MCIFGAKKGTLTGTVIDSVTKKPVADAVILVNGIQSTTTDSNGKYTIKNLKVGTDIIEFEKTGYTNVID